MSNEKKTVYASCFGHGGWKSVNPWPIIAFMIKALVWWLIFDCYQCKLIIFVRCLNYSIKNFSLSKPAKTIGNNKAQKINCILTGTLSRMLMLFWRQLAKDELELENFWWKSCFSFSPHSKEHQLQLCLIGKLNQFFRAYFVQFQSLHWPPLSPLGLLYRQFLLL